MSRRNGAPNGTPEKSVPSTPQDKQVRLLSQEVGHFSFIRAMHLADLITELNGLCGILSIFASMRYCLGDPNTYDNIWIALSLLPLGLFFDFMDGRVARWRKKASLMGQELDSLADLISFGAAPACVALALGLRTAVDHLILAFFVLCGLSRLARFNVTAATLPHDATGKAKYFEGTPIPTTLLLDGMMGLWVRNGWVHENIPLGTVFTGTTWEFHPITLLFALHGSLMVSKTLKVPKP